MKNKKKVGKLVLKKSTITNLNNQEMEKLFGGDMSTDASYYSYCDDPICKYSIVPDTQCAFCLTGFACKTL